MRNSDKKEETRGCDCAPIPQTNNLILNKTMKKQSEFPTKFWVILGVTFLMVGFSLLVGFDILEIGEMGIRLVK